jgi:tetratricopeptide (TPR) repeat protein
MPAHRLLAGALVAASIAIPSHAAVSVIGSGLARICYEAAESERATRDGVESCDQALAEQALSVRDRAATYVNRGILGMRQKKHAAAIADYEQAIRLKPDLAEAYVNKGIALVHVGGRDGEAVNFLSRGIDLNPVRPEVAYYTRAVANEALGRTRAAYEDYRQAAALKPDWAEPQKQLQRFSVVSGKPA